jgi:hypothetical protein
VANTSGNRIEQFNSSGSETNYGNSISAPTFIAVQPPLVPIPLKIGLAGKNVVLTWVNSSDTFSLQIATTVAGPYTTITGAISPYTNSITAAERFFRLISN